LFACSVNTALRIILTVFICTAALGARAADPGHGQTLYKNICATCHNAGGNPGPGPIMLGAWNADAIDAALHTVPEMTAFEGLFKRSDLEDIAAYLGALFGIPPPAPPAAPPTSLAIEYYHAAFDHYFVTAIADEITKLDNGTFAGWTRTGRQFKVFTATGNALSAVCRFFSTSFAPKSSHFYTALANECTAVKANPDWQFEAEVFFVAQPAVDGSCASGTIPVYRVYNNGQGAAPNHRLTTELEVRAQMLAKGWIAEGAGIGVTMCVPP
jgi:cytochrome c2